ncbi:TPA: hypothetical protein ACVU34_004709 [Vibrio parahaemolyticus]
MNNSDKKKLVLPKIAQRQRNHTREIARKLETVKRQNQSENNSYSATGANMKGTFDPV